MADNRIVIINRRISSIEDAAEVAGIHKGEWFIAQDTKVLYWKSPITNRIETIAGTDDGLIVRNSISSLSNGAALAKIKDGEWFSATDTGLLYWKNPITKLPERVSRQDEVVSGIVPNVVSTITDTVAIGKVKDGDWFVAANTKILYWKNPVTKAAEQVTQQSVGDSITLPATVPNISDSIALAKIKNGEWFTALDTKILYWKNTANGLPEQVSSQSVGDSITLPATVSSINNTAAVAKIKDGEWFTATDTKVLYWKNPVTKVAEQVSKQSSGDNVTVPTVVTSIGNTTAVNGIKAGEWFTATDTKILYWKNPASGLVEQVSKQSEAVSAIVPKVVPTIGSTAAIAAIKDGEWFTTNDTKNLYWKNPVTKVAELITKQSEVVSGIVPSIVPTITDTVALSKIKGGDWFTTADTRVLYWKNPNTNVAERISKQDETVSAITPKTVSAITNTTAVNAIKDGEWFTATDTKILYWKNPVTKVAERISKQDETVSAITPKTVSSITNTGAVTAIPKGTWFLAVDTNKLYWKNPVTSIAELITKQDEAVSAIVTQTIPALTNSVALGKIKNGEWFITTDTNKLYVKNPATGLPEQINRQDEAVSAIVSKSVPTITNSTELAKIKSGEWFTATDTKILYVKNPATGLAEQVTYQDSLKITTISNLADSAGLNKLKNGDWFTTNDTKIIYLKHPITGTTERITKQNELVETLVTKSVSSIGNTGAVNTIKSGEWFVAADTKILYIKNPNNGKIEQISSQKPDSTNAIVTNTVNTVTNTTAVGSLKGGEYFSATDTGILYWKNPKTNAAEQISHQVIDPNRGLLTNVPSLLPTSNTNSIRKGEMFITDDTNGIYWRNKSSVIQPLVSNVAISGANSLRTRGMAHVSNTPFTLDLELHDYFRITSLNGAALINFNVINSSDTSMHFFVIEIPITGGTVTVGWFGSVRWAGGVAPTTKKESTMVVSFFGNSTVGWKGTVLGHYY